MISITQLTYALAKTKVCSDKGQWNGNSKPQSKQGNQSTKRYCAGAALSP